LAGTAPGEKNLNLRALIAAESLLRILRLAIEHHEGDLESFAVYLAVITAGSGRMLRDPELQARYGDSEPLPDEARAGISRRAIADSLGLPRETVRRKIARLIERELVFERDGLVAAHAPVVPDRPQAREFTDGMIREFERAGGLLQRHPDG
jgi:CRP-like cAMP-binding protein